MRFENYITEEYLFEDFDTDRVFELVEKNCSDIFNVMKKNHNVLWRGVKTDTSSNIIEEVPRIDRKPRDTKQWLHDKLDDAFKVKFGWKVRSEGIFATSSIDFAKQFGKPYMFFPFDGYKYVWNPYVRDLTAKIISVNIDLDKLDDLELKMWATDRFLEINKPNFKTGVGKGHWSIENGNAEVDDVESLIRYYKDHQKWYEYKQTFEIHQVSTTDVVEKVGPEYVIEYEIDGNVKHAYWVANIHDKDYKELHKIASYNMNVWADNRIKKIMKDYTDKDLNRAFTEMGEISFKCKKYYIVHEKMRGMLFDDQ